MQEILFTIKGTMPLLMNNVRMANPLDEHTQRAAQVSKKRTKTLDDHEILAKLEFLGRLYFDDEIGPYIPGANVHKVLLEGAKAHRLGTTVRAAVMVMEDKLPLQYDGPRDVEGLWKAGFHDQRIVKVASARTLRTRPMFIQWALSGTIQFDESVLDPDQIERALDIAGRSKGLGDYRPQYGRFEAEVAR